MRINSDKVPAKPFLSWTFVQGAEDETIVFKGHTSMQAAKRSASKLMAEVRDTAEGAEPREGCDRCHCGSKYWEGRMCVSCGSYWSPRVLMSWGYQKIEDYERTHGIVL